MTLAIHQLEGRLRIKSPKFQEETFQQEVLFSLLKQKGVENISINSKNSCLTLHYNPNILNLEQIKFLLGLEEDFLNKDKKIKKSTGAYEQDLQVFKQFKKSASSDVNFEKSKVILVDLAKVFGSTWFKTALKETVSLAFKGASPTGVSRKFL